MNYPSDLKYSRDHEWLRVEDDNTAYIGITDFAQKELGDIVYVELTETGKALGKDETFGTVEAIKTVSEVYMPVDGKILEVNAAVNDEPELVNSDPYGDGWLARIQITAPEQVSELMDAAKYTDYIHMMQSE